MVVNTYSRFILNLKDKNERYNELLLSYVPDETILAECGFNTLVKTTDSNNAGSMSDWCKNNLHHDIILHIKFLSFDIPTGKGTAEYYWYFQNPKEAMLFKLKWC